MAALVRFDFFGTKIKPDYVSKEENQIDGSSTRNALFISTSSKVIFDWNLDSVGNRQMTFIFRLLIKIKTNTYSTRNATFIEI